VLGERLWIEAAVEALDFSIVCKKGKGKKEEKES